MLVDCSPATVELIGVHTAAIVNVRGFRVKYEKNTGD